MFISVCLINVCVLWGGFTKTYESIVGVGSYLCVLSSSQTHICVSFLEHCSNYIRILHNISSCNISTFLSSPSVSHLNNVGWWVSIVLGCNLSFRFVFAPFLSFTIPFFPLTPSFTSMMASNEQAMNHNIFQHQFKRLFA